MSCPFKSLIGSSSQSDHRKGQCPFTSSLKGLSLDGDSPQIVESSVDEAQPSKQKPPSGQCPYGFGSGSMPKMSILHCTLCTSLLYECVKLKDCGHRFCKFCIERFNDCPVCGADIKSLCPDEEMQGIVSKYIEVHSGNHTIWELDSGLPPGKIDDPSGMERSVASFYLQLGIRSYIGGNLVAAKCRLQLSCDDLEKQISESTDIADRLRSQTGAVYGSLGDCSKRLGDTDSAMSYYAMSIDHLKAAPESPEAKQELPVALNKLGDIHYILDDVNSAKKCYTEALRIREAIVQAASEPDAGQLLELAVSLTKVADSEQVLDHDRKHRQLLSRAKVILSEIESCGKTFAGKQAAIYSSLIGFLRGP